MAPRVDKIEKESYIFYCGATDETGSKLATALKMIGTAKVPPNTASVIIGWGAKIQAPISFGEKVIVLNHPNAIMANRNKAGALKTMKDAGVNIATFLASSSILDALQSKKMSLPLIGRTNSHQGGKGLWLCPTIESVKAAITDGAQYFQQVIGNKDEYRLHVFKNSIIYAQKKVPRENLQQAYVEQHAEKILHNADKHGTKIDKTTMDLVLKQLSKDAHVDQVVKSNTRGWKFSSVTKEKVNSELSKQAIKAVGALKLDFGAVDCCIDGDGKAWVIEVNTGPGLDGSTFDTYVKTFTSFLQEASKTDSVVEKAKIMEKKATVASPIIEKDSIKSELLHKVGLLQEMVTAADTDEDAAALKRIAAKLFKQ